MSEIELERALQEQIAKTPVGEKVTLNFTGIPTIIDVEMSFAGGWRITQTIIPGRAFEFFGEKMVFSKASQSRFNLMRDCSDTPNASAELKSHPDSGAK